MYGYAIGRGETIRFSQFYPCIYDRELDKWIRALKGKRVLTKILYISAQSEMVDRETRQVLPLSEINTPEFAAKLRNALPGCPQTLNLPSPAAGNASPEEIAKAETTRKTWYDLVTCGGLKIALAEEALCQQSNRIKRESAVLLHLTRLLRSNVTSEDFVLKRTRLYQVCS